MGRTKTLRIALLALATTAVAWLGTRVGHAAPTAEARYRAVHVIDVRDEVEPALAAYLERSLKAAVAAKADCIVLRIESPGGRVDSMERMIDAVLAVPKTVRTIAWIPKEAYSAASLTAIACDEVVMAPGARMGDAQPIFMTEKGIEPVGEKAETVLRALVRRLAEDNGWDPIVAEKLISKDKEVLELRPRGTDRRLYVHGEDFASARDDDLVGGVPKRDLERVRVAIPKDRLLTMTTDEARDFGFVRRTFPDEPTFLAALKADGATVTLVEMSWREKASRWLLGVTGVLGALVMLCVGMTVFQGIGVSTIVGVCALLLVGMVTVTADLPNGFPLLLIGIGILLLAAEAFLLPGFGIAGILGIVATAAGFLSLATGFTLDSPGTLSWDVFAGFLGQFAATLVVGGVFLVLISRVVPSLPFARRQLHLSADGLGAGAVAVPGDVAVAVGATGTATTDLRPAGRATVDGRVVDVTSEGGWVEGGTAVRVVRVEGARVFVRPAEGRAP
ncbi:MAG: NfeD family protein [Planctomycetota bacterium]